MNATRPRVHMFSPDQVEGVVRDAIRTLETVGVFVENAEALALLDGAGLTPRDNRVRIDERAIRTALATAPSRIVLYDRDGEEACDLSGDRVHFDPGSAALHILDPGTGRRRPPVLADLVHLAWIVQTRSNLAAQSTSLVPSDVGQTMQDWVRLFVALSHSSKPVVTGTFLKESFSAMRAMLEAIRGGARELADKPLAVFDCCPTPPLKWSDLTGQALLDCARAGIPAELISMPLAGATSPVTLREMVVQHCAESLSGVVIHQLARAGSPIVYGGCPAAFDMRHGTTPMGAIETMMVEVGYAQIGKHLGLPTHAYMGLSDSKGVDWQAGMETGTGVILAALAGINMVSGAGILDFVLCQSLEKLVLDDEACGAALRFVRGIDHDPATDAPALLGEVVAAGHFLAHRHTRLHHRTELRPAGRVIDRATYDDWESKGARSSLDAAREEVMRILAKGCPEPLDGARAMALEVIADEECGRAGVELPAALRVT